MSPLSPALSIARRASTDTRWGERASSGVDVATQGNVESEGEGNDEGKVEG